MKVLITGVNGFLGFYLVRQLLDKEIHVIATGKGACRLPFAGEKNFTYASMDINEPFEVHDVFEKYQPNVVVHAGAMSKPDECEEEQWRCYVTNVEGTLNVLMNAAEQHCFFVFVSTDFVFDGEKGMYREEDKPAPVNFYGTTKMEGEEAVFEYEHEWAIVRTVLVYGRPVTGRQNIISIVRDKLQKGEEYQVVNDQVRTPTYVEDLAAGIVSIIEKKVTGIYHISGNEVLTPYDMACQAADYLGLNKNLLIPVSTKEFKQAAQRPLKTGFVIDKARKELGFEPVTFAEGLHKTFSAE